MAARVEIRPCLDDADEHQSLEIYNAVWPRDAVGIEEVRSFKQQATAWSDELASLDDDVVASAFTAIRPDRPDLPVVFLTVAAHSRRRGVGTALYRSASAWAVARGLDRLEAIVEEDDDESLSFAHRRGFVEHERNRRVVLDLAGREPPPVDPPDGVEIVTLADRPELARDLYDVHVEATPDIPGQETDALPSYEEWLRHSMSGPGDPPEAVVRRGRGRSRRGLREVLPQLGPTDRRVPRPHRRPSCLAGPRRGRRAETRADRLGEGAWL
jgi:GNAT superfamily N-acetyltransferase